MSRKHNQRTRAEILAKREQPIAKWAGWKVLGGAPAFIATTHPLSRSKYTPHIGAKEQERAKRCYMVSAFIGGVPRSAPTMNQMSKRQYDEPAYYPAMADAREQEYESVF